MSNKELAEVRHIAQGADLEWQAKVFHEEMDKLGVPRHDGEDFYSLYGRANLARAALAAQPVAQAPDQKDDYVGWYCAHCRRGVDGSEVTFREQHTECGRVITNDRPPAPEASKPVQAEAPTQLVRAIMAKLANLLDEDQFKDIEDMVVRAGVTHSPASGVVEREEMFSSHMRLVVAYAQQYHNHRTMPMRTSLAAFDAAREAVETSARAALATQPLEQKPVAWGAVHFGGKRNGKLYNHCETEQQIDDYISQIHRSSDSITLSKAPLYLGPAHEA